MLNASISPRSPQEKYHGWHTSYKLKEATYVSKKRNALDKMVSGNVWWYLGAGRQRNYSNFAKIKGHLLIWMILANVNVDIYSSAWLNWEHCTVVGRRWAVLFLPLVCSMVRTFISEQPPAKAAAAFKFRRIKKWLFSHFVHVEALHYVISSLPTKIQAP